MALDLQAITEALAKATPGPWESMFIGGPLGQDVYEIGPEGSHPVAVCGDGDIAHLIVLLRNHAAELVAGVERDALVYAQNAAKAVAERDAAVAQVAKQDSLLAEFTSIVQRQNAERNDLVAQVAVLVEAIGGRPCPVCHGDSLHPQRCDACNTGGRMWDYLGIPSPGEHGFPAAAARFLAADAACRAILPLIVGRDHGAFGVAADVETELDEWRKAGRDG